MPVLIDSNHVLGKTPLLSAADCLSDQDHFKDRLLIFKPDQLRPEFRYAEFQYFYAFGGFGCDPKSRGSKIFGYFLADGERAELRRSDFLGVADTQKLPKWAADRLSEIESPKMQIRIFQIDHDKDPNRLAYEPLQHFTDGKPDASMYRQVYGGTVNCGSLEEVFRLCNENPPPGFYGESMSVGNVVEICEGEQKGFYFCDRTGFPKVEFDINQTDRAKMLTVLICEPNKEPYKAEIRDCLKFKQSIVGGLIEPVYFSNENVLAFCDEEFLFKGCAPNRILGETLIQGTFFIVGDAYNDEGEKVEISLTNEQIAAFTEQFRYPLVDISDNAVAVQEELEPSFG